MRITKGSTVSNNWQLKHHFECNLWQHIWQPEVNKPEPVQFFADVAPLKANMKMVLWSHIVYETIVYYIFLTLKVCYCCRAFAGNPFNFVDVSNRSTA